MYPASSENVAGGFRQRSRRVVGRVVGAVFRRNAQVHHDLGRKLARPPASGDVHMLPGRPAGRAGGRLRLGHGTEEVVRSGGGLRRHGGMICGNCVLPPFRARSGPRPNIVQA
jgi:hypothetical protein